MDTYLRNGDLVSMHITVAVLALAVLVLVYAVARADGRYDEEYYWEEVDFDDD